MPSRRRSARGRSGRKPVKSPPAAADNSRGEMLDDIGLGELRRLIRLVQRTGIGELEVSSGGRTVRISAHTGVPAGAGLPAAASGAGRTPETAHPAAPAPGAGKADAYIAIASPMVGTFYRAPAPDADPYVEVGDMVEVGQTVCIVEAMKLMNEIESEVRGRIAQILVENSHPVEFGQKLFLIEPV